MQIGCLSQYSIVRQMNVRSENQWPSNHLNPQLPDSYLANLTIKQIKFYQQNDHNQKPYQMRFRNMKNLMPTSIIHHPYNKLQNKNSKLLPGLKFRQIASAKVEGQDKKFAAQQFLINKNARSQRNADILNCLIDILKDDPDKEQAFKSRNARTKTLPPTCQNQFIQSNQISSVRNSRGGPKIISNQIMMQNPKNRRNLVSQEKSRTKLSSGQQSNYLSSNISSRRKPDVFEMQMTFYKPSKIVAPNNQKQKQRSKDTSLNFRIMQQNQFIV